jgi:hypothetical protein
VKINPFGVLRATISPQSTSDADSQLRYLQAFHTSSDNREHDEQLTHVNAQRGDIAEHFDLRLGARQHAHRWPRLHQLRSTGKE